MYIVRSIDKDLCWCSEDGDIMDACSYCNIPLCPEHKHLGHCLGCQPTFQPHTNTEELCQHEVMEEVEMCPFERMIENIAHLTKDGELTDGGYEFILENDDAVDTLHALIEQARNLVKSYS